MLSVSKRLLERTLFFSAALPARAARHSTKHSQRTSRVSRYSSRTKDTHPYYVEKTPHLLTCLEESTRKRDEIRLKQAQTNGNLRKAIRDRLRLLWTYNSNAIEGSGLTLSDTRFLLEDGITVGGKRLKDYVDAQNHAHAIDALHEVVEKKHPINPVLLREINRILLSSQDYVVGVDPSGNLTRSNLRPGEYKTEPNYVNTDDGIHEYVLPHDVEFEMTRLCDWLEGKGDHPVVQAAVGHYNKARIHPFTDGNGRGARILMNLVLMRDGYQPGVIQVNARERYLRTLRDADKGNLSPFTEFVAESVIETQNDILEIVDEYVTEHTSSNSPGI